MATPCAGARSTARPACLENPRSRVFSSLNRSGEKAELVELREMLFRFPTFHHQIGLAEYSCAPLCLGFDAEPSL